MGHVLDAYLSATKPKSKLGDPPWEVALLFPPQGTWSDDEYFALGTNRFVEYDNGRLEVLPLPTDLHQAIAFLFALLLRQHVLPKRLGRVRMGALPMYTIETKYREPDVLFMLAANIHRCHRKYWVGADLVMEVVSPGKENRQRDLLEKRKEYAATNIPEYWIVDPDKRRVIVLTLQKNKYVVHGVFGPRSVATSVLLPDFSVDVADLLAAE